jgi:hypothetical protein
MLFVSRRWPWPAGAILLVAALCLGRSSGLSAQPTRHTPATLAGLNAYTTFFHRRPVVVRARSEGDLQDVFLTDGEHRIRVLNVAPPVAGDNALLEIDGTFWDAGRLLPTDPRLEDQGIRRLSERLFNKAWPSSGELLLLIADETRRADEPDDATIRTITMEPARYLDQTVTVTGRFRGRNLYGDLAEAPGVSRTDFVLQSAEAAIWVVGKEPRGRDFDLDVMARVDTGRWLQVTGIVGGSDRLVEIVAEDIEQVERPVSPPSTLTEDLTEVGPPPEVIFSAPTQDDIDIAIDALVRFQFSRDMDAESFEDNVEVVYFGAAARDAADSADPADPADPADSDDGGDGDGLEFDVAYRPRNRVISVTFAEPLLPYRTIEVRLGNGILATDGAMLVPHTLIYTTGGS